MARRTRKGRGRSARSTSSRRHSASNTEKVRTMLDTLLDRGRDAVGRALKKAGRKIGRKSRDRAARALGSLENLVHRGKMKVSGRRIRSTRGSRKTR